MHLKNKLLKIKETDRNYYSFFYDKQLTKEKFVILTKKDTLLCVDEYEYDSEKEQNKHFIHYKIIKVFYDSSILYIPISITKYKKSNSVYADKFVVL